MSIERLKFRGKATRDWLVTGDDPTPKKGDWIHSEASRMSQFWEMVEKDFVDPATVGQFTGLKDKNGVEIYEGDVVRVQFDGKNDDNIVVWDVKNAIWAIADSDLRPFGCFDLFYKEYPEIEVISNVHEAKV